MIHKPALLALLILIWGCGLPEVPYQPGLSHCVRNMSVADRESAMAWQKWKHAPVDAAYDPLHDPGMGESQFNEPDKPGRLYCPKGMLLSWDLGKIGTSPNYFDAEWVAHCYYVSATKSF